LIVRPDIFSTRSDPFAILPEAFGVRESMEILLGCIKPSPLGIN